MCLVGKECPPAIFFYIFHLRLPYTFAGVSCGHGQHGTDYVAQDSPDLELFPRIPSFL